MSKKLIYIRISIVAVCLLFASLFILLFNNIQESINVDKTIVEETTTSEEKIVFDLKKAPREQRKIISKHRVEYLRELYKSIFGDDKVVNCTPLLSYDSLVDDFKSVKTLVEFIKPLPYRNLPIILFEFSNINVIKKYFLDFPINMDDLPVTENYKQKHPKPLYEEFDFIKKEDYKYPKIFHNEYMDFDYWYEFNYTYHVGVDEENKIIGVGEDKHVSLLFIDEETNTEHSGIVRDKNGNEAPAYIETRAFYFKYTTDEKGYVDDIVYDRTEVLADDKYLDNLIKYE